MRLWAHSLGAFLLLFQYSATFDWKCPACKAAVEVLKFAYQRNATHDAIINSAIYICKHFADQDSLICQGITSQFRESFLYVIEQLLFRPSQLCGLILSDCGNPHNPFDGNWTIPLPPKPNFTMPIERKKPKKVFRVLQLSDLHFDYRYTPGAEVECGHPICCQMNKSDVDVTKPAGYWGTVAACDVPYWTIENMLQHINKTHSVDYIILTGDYMSHSDWNYTRQGHLDVIANFSGLIENYFPHTPIFWGIGNHEGVPVNSFAPHFAPSKFRPQWLYKAIYSANRPWIPAEENPTMIYRGSYSVMLTEKLKLISLNTGYCDTTNFFLYINQTDPDQTLSWLVDELYKSEQMNQSAHIMAHIPPGDGECLEGWSRNYYRIVNRFEKTIKAQFFGHVHTDAFTVFYENMDDFHSRPTSVLYMAPSVTTFEHLNPAYRIYTIDGNYRDSSYDVLDFETYFLNLTATKDTEQPKWELLYKAKEEYGLDDLAAKSWHSLSEQIRTNNTIYDIFLKNYARRHDYPCNEHCRGELLCSLRRGHHNETALCPEGTFIRGKVFPALFKRQFPSVEPTVEEPFTRDSFIDATRKSIWDKVSKWIRER